VALSLTFSVAAAFTAAVPLPAAFQAPEATLAPAKTPSHVVLRRWLGAVSSHRPGDADAAAQAIASWTADDLEQLLPGLVWYLDLARSALQKQPARRGEPADVCPTCDASRRERTRLLRATRSRAPHDGLLKDFPRPDRLNDLIVRGVMLHSDAAMRFRVAAPAEREQPSVQRRSNTPGSYNVLQIPPEIVNSADGQFIGTTAAVGHWYMARALLQFMMPEPALTPLTRQWYLAATTHFAATTNFAQLESHLAAAQALFPNDAALAFDRGWQAELAAGPLIQHDVRSLLDVALQRAPRRRFSPLYCGAIVPCDKDNNPYGVKNVGESLSDAERAFARAIALDATMTEAHVRLAHVRLLLGRPTDALRQFERLPQSEDAVVSFYAALIKGKALEAVDRLDDAAAAYHRGLELFPDAASVNLALSSIEQRRGDTSRAASFARRAVESPDGNPPGMDPFAVYFLGRGRTVDEAWRRFVAALEQPQ
jgi:tetratricopeptide (TPR) repeat protein